MTLVAIAGDIATSGTGDAATAALITAINPTYVITLGDNAYNDGSTSNFTTYYAPTWGAFLAKTRATPGNHDWVTAGAAGYKAYFGSANVTNPIDGGTYYSWDVPGTLWHIVTIDISSYSGGGGTVLYTVGSAQYTWLANDLAAAKAAGKHIIVCDHFPRYSSGTVHGSTPELANLWTLMSNNGVVLFFSGHEHSYERFAPMDAFGAPSDSGVRQVVVGTGGAGLYGFVSTPVANSAFRLSTWGVLFLDLQDTYYDATFRKTDQSVSDQWTQSFTGQPPLADSPKALLEQVGSATARRYAAKDSANISMDTAKIIEKTQADGGGYLAVYQYLSGGTQWQVRLADSTDLLNWTFRTTLELDGSQATIYRHPTAGYFTGCEYNAGGGGQLRIRRYASLAALLANTPTHTATITRTLSACNEGTPNFYSVVLSPDIDHAVIDIGYHYHWNCDVDRQARGTLTNWTTWSGAAQATLNTAVINAGDSRAPYALVRQTVRTAAAGTSTTQTGLTSTAGNLLVATVQRGGGSTASVTSITDSAGNTWAKSSEGSVVGQNNTQVSIWSAQLTGAVTSITLNGSGSWTWGVNLSEWSGGLTTGVGDGGSGAGRSVSPILTPTFTPTAGDLVIGALATDAATAVKNTLNFTSLTDFTNGATLGRAAYAVEAVGDQEVSWTAGTGYTNAGVAIAGFKRATLGGNIGDRDNFTYTDADWVVLEGQGVKNDFSTWRSYLYNPRQQAAQRLTPVTAAGSTAFANPTATVLTSPAGKTALAVTYFIPSQGAGTGEAGELIFYTEYAGGPPPAQTDTVTFTAPTHPSASQVSGHDEPDVHLFGGTYYLYYRVNTNGGEIAVATSSDGATWTNQGTMIPLGTAGAWDDAYVISPSVVLVGSTYYCFYEGNHAGVSKIGYATSSDPLGPWTKNSSNPILSPQGSGFEQTLVGTPAVAYINGTWYLHYHGWNAVHDQVALAWSTDLTTWTRHPLNPTLPVSGWYAGKVAPSDVIVIGDWMYVFLEGDPGTGKWAIGVAQVLVAELKTSTLSLNAGSATAPMYQGLAGNWDNDYVQLPCVWPHPTDPLVLWMWYSGHNSTTNSFSLGRANVLMSGTGTGTGGGGTGGGGTTGGLVGGFTDTVEAALLDYFMATYTPTTKYLGLSSTTPTEAGANITEPSGGAYARVATTAADWAAAVPGAPATKTNTATLTWPTATSDWWSGAPATHWVMWSAATGGTALCWAPLKSAKTVLSGGTASLGAGSAVIALGDPSDLFP